MVQPNGSQPPEPEGDALSPEVEAVFRRFIDAEIGGILRDALPGIVRSEIQILKADLQAGLEQRAQAQATQQAQPEGAEQPQSAALEAGDFWHKIDVLSDVADRVFDKYIAFRQTNAALDMDTNPIGVAQRLQEKWPTVMAMHAPNPYGEGFQTIMTQLTLNGVRIGLAAKGGVGQPAPLAPDGSVNPSQSPTGAPSAPSTAPPNGQPSVPVVTLTAEEINALQGVLDAQQTKPAMSPERQNELVLQAMAL